MSELTKEWLLKTIAELEEERDAVPGAVNEDAAMSLAAMKRALASLEAEAVAYVMADDLKDSSIISTPAYRDLGEAMERTVGDVVALYTTPPAPVSVPEPIKRNDADGWWMYKGRRVGGGCAEWYNRALDDCRAAMLQAGTPVQFGWSKGHFGYHTLFNAIGKAVNIQEGALSISVSAFEDAMLAAAPQQEVK